jgi:hypothetical protein
MEFGRDFSLLRFIAKILGKRVYVISPIWLALLQKRQILPEPRRTIYVCKYQDKFCQMCLQYGCINHFRQPESDDEDCEFKDQTPASQFSFYKTSYQMLKPIESGTNITYYQCQGELRDSCSKR